MGEEVDETLEMENHFPPLSNNGVLSLKKKPPSASECKHASKYEQNSEGTPNSGTDRELGYSRDFDSEASLSVSQGGLEPELKSDEGSNVTLRTVPKVARTLQMASSWLKKTRKTSREQPKRVDSFLEKLEMVGPPVTVGNLEPSDDPDKFNVATYTHWTVDPSGRFVYFWLNIISFAVVYNWVFIIARQCFYEIQTQYLVLWFVLDYICDIIYGLDIVVQFRTAYLDQGLLVRDLKKLRQNYMAKTKFKLDIVSLLPFDFLYVVMGTRFTICRALRLLRMHRVLKLFQKGETKSSHPNLLQTFAVVLVILLVFHWNACFYFKISESIGFGTDKWVYPNLSAPGYDKLSRQYLYSFYWSTRMMITGESENPPETDMELLFVVVDLTLGYLAFAALVGQFGAILGHIMRARVDFLTHSNSIKTYLHNHDVNNDLQDRVISWIDYMWHKKRSLDHERVLRKLPDKLRAQIAVHVYLEVLRQVTVFADCEPGLLREIVVKLRSQVFSPGDYICRKGDVGREMYIVNTGCLQVVGDDGTTVLAILSEGSYFGEISIMNLTGVGNRRTADVRSVGFSDLLCLSKYDLLEAMSDFPEARRKLEERGRELLRRTSKTPQK